MIIKKSQSVEFFFKFAEIPSFLRILAVFVKHLTLFENIGSMSLTQIKPDFTRFFGPK
jgi:hypothetical protein